MRIALVLAWFLAALSAFGAEWFDAYEKGVAALSKRDAVQAVEQLEAAVRARPEPGDNVLTYGTNRLRRYHPYLRLAEAHLLAGRADKALLALEASEAFGREPLPERAALRLRAESAGAPAAPAAPPSSNVASTESPALVAALSAGPTPTPAPGPTTAPTAEGRAASVVPRSAAPRTDAGQQVGSAVEPRALPPAPTATPTVAPSLEVFTRPGGAQVYLDDELIGVTDSISGRLIRSGVARGSHSIRAGNGSLQGAVLVDVNPEGPTTVRMELLKPASPRVFLGILALVLAAFAGGLSWLRHRRRAGRDGATTARSVKTGTLDRTASALVTPRGTTFGAETRALPTPPRGAGETFGDFVLTGLLGRGGMALVYRAERGGDVFALKRPLNALLEDGEFLERFLREAEIGRTLHHPNIVRIHERGEVGGIPYFTMELVEGETLQARIRRGGALAPRGAAILVAQVAEALDYAHLKGVVHRDLKPSNIMLEPSGMVRVMDYGIARAVRFEGLTITGSFLGTPDYAAPETAEGGVADARSDLYSLGVILYECLTGQKLFSGDTPFALLRRHCDEEPLPPSLVTPGIPEQLEDIVLRLLSKKPADRHRDAETLLLDLRDFLNRAA